MTDRASERASERTNEHRTDLTGFEDEEDLGPQNFPLVRWRHAGFESEKKRERKVSGRKRAGETAAVLGRAGRGHGTNLLGDKVLRETIEGNEVVAKSP